MIGYFELFPEMARSELRHVTFRDGHSHGDIPEGTYVFTEYYCPDLDCDCDRVLVKVWQERGRGVDPREVATISYTWNQHPDASWISAADGAPNPHLDPLNPTAPFAEDLLSFWRSMLAEDRQYQARLQQHSRELREAVGTYSDSDDGEIGVIISSVPARDVKRTRAARKVQRQRVAQQRRRRKSR